jgi:hypothetical protein
MEKKEVTKEKLTYEELNNVCHQLSEQSRTLYQQLQEANLTNAFRRLDYLFAVLDKHEFFEDSFVEKCAAEIVNMITIPEAKPEEEEK